MRRISLSSTVSKRNAAASSARSGRRAASGSRRTSPGGRATPRPAPAGRGTPGWPRSVNQAASSSGARPPMPGRSSRGRLAEGAGRSPKNGTTTGFSTVIAPMMTRRAGRSRPASAGRRPRSQSSPDIGRLPGGRDAVSSTSRPSGVASAGRSPSRTIGPGHVAASPTRATRRRGHDEPLAVELEERAGPRAGRRGPGAPAPRPAASGSRRPSSRRSGRVSVDAVAPAAGTAAQLAAQPGPEAPVQQLAGDLGEVAPPGPGRARRPSSGTSTRATIGSRVEPRVHAHQASRPSSRSPARIVAGIGAAPRHRGSADGCRLSAPCGRSSRAGGTIWP